jgi:Ca2+-binding EF-hand superfamily protein
MLSDLAGSPCVAAQDEDGKISEEDLLEFCQEMELGCSEASIRAFYESLDTQRQGFIGLDEWTTALMAAEQLSEEVLVTRGVTVAQDTSGNAGTTGLVTSRGTAQNMEAVADMLAAALKYNELTPAEGFEELDIDEDDRISLSDLSAAVQTLGLTVEPDALTALHQAMDKHGTGLVELGPWCEMLSNRKTADVLRSRGVDESQLSVGVDTSAESAGVSAQHDKPVPPASTASALPAGLPTGASVPRSSASDVVKEVSSTIAAVISFNNLDRREGFEAFDADEDELISIADLREAVSTLDMQVLLHIGLGCRV